jgi:RES domain-containing protein
VRVWRLTRAVHRDTAPTGFGAKRFGGRWNSRGVACVYASQSPEIALLEALVHVDLAQLPRDLLAMELEVPDDAVANLVTALPEAWDAPPPYSIELQAIGDRWVRAGESLALTVPASVLPQRFNVLINPAHPRMSEIPVVGAEALPWPRRLLAYLEKGAER